MHPGVYRLRRGFATGAITAISWGRGPASQPDGVFGCIADDARLRTHGRDEREGRHLRHSRVRVRLEMAVALSAGVLGILTIFWHDWIEALTGQDPDQHNGSAEWLVVAGLLAVAVTAGLTARRHWRLLTASPQHAAASGGQKGAVRP